MISVIEALATRISTKNQKDLLSGKIVKPISYPHNFNKIDDSLIPAQLNLDDEYCPLVETLVDRFFDFLDTDLNPRDSNQESLEEKIFDFCERNNLSIRFQESHNLKGQLVNNTILIHCNLKEHSERQIIYVILHELSHYITNNASNSKLKEFLNEPNKVRVNFNSIDSLERELKYILSPAELSNWAFDLSLKVYELTNMMPNELYRIIKNEVKDLDNLLKSTQYNRAHDDLKPLFYIVYYVHRLKYLSNDKSVYKIHMNRLNHLINLMGKYVKRLTKLFGKPAKNRAI